MVKIVKVTDEAHAKLEIFGKDSGLGISEAATKLILTNVDIATAKNYQQNNNCIFDLYAANIDGGKDFGCMIKRQFQQLRDPAKVNELLTFCKSCPRMRLVKEQFKFEKMLDGDKPIKPNKPQHETAAAIKAEIAKDVAALAPTVAAAKKVEPVTARPAWINKNAMYVKCDACSFSVYNDSDADKAMQDLETHKTEVHGSGVLTNNEVNQLKILNRLILQSGKKEAA